MYSHTVLWRPVNFGCAETSSGPLTQTDLSGAGGMWVSMLTDEKNKGQRSSVESSVR
jgi:hypothetical protein